MSADAAAFAAQESIKDGEWDAHLFQLAEAIVYRQAMITPSVNPTQRYPLPTGQVWAWMNPHDGLPGQWQIRGTGVVLTPEQEEEQRKRRE